MSSIGGKMEFRLAALERRPRALVATARSLAAVALLTAAHLTGDWTQPASAAEAGKTDRVLPVTVVKVRLAAGYEVRERYAGRVVARRASFLGFEHQGLLAEVRVEEGDRVKKGDILATLNVTRYQAQHRELLADLTLNFATWKETKARLGLAQVTAKRRKSLLKSNNVSRQRYDEALFNEKALQSKLSANDAAIEKVKAAIALIEVDIKLSKIFAPFDGMIVERLVDEGAALAAGTSVVRLIEDSVMEVRIGVPTKIAQRLNKAASYDIEIDGRTYPGKLRTVLSVLDVETRAVPAIFEIKDETGSGSLRSGQLARIRIDYTVPEEGFWLPISALIGGRRGLWNAMALELEDKVQNLYRVSRREVQVLHSEAERAYVRGAIKNGDQIISDGLHRVVPGQVVRLSGSAK